MPSTALQLHPEWNKPSDRYGSLAVLRNLIPLLLACAAAPALADRNPYLAWSLSPVLGLLLYRLTIVMHDCGHGTLFTAKRANRWIGECLGGIAGIDFRQFQRLHFDHHRNYGEQGDPQGFHYIGIACMSPIAFAWHVCKPLFGANLRHVFAESYLHPRNLLGMFRSGRFLFVVPLQLGLIALVTGFGAHYWMAFVPAISAATFGLFLSQIRGIAEHGSADATQQVGFVRSHEQRWIERLLLYDLHFNLHEEHHRHPQIPSCHLPAVQASTTHSTARGSMYQSLKILAG